MLSTSNTSGFRSQDREIENLLRSRYAQWVPCYEVQEPAGRRILQYGRAINSIRKRLLKFGDRERIENKTEWVDGQCHGFYRIVSTVKSAPISSFSEEKREETEQKRPVGDTRHERAKQFERQFRPGWKSRPFSEKRMAQDDCFRLTPPEPRQ